MDLDIISPETTVQTVVEFALIGQIKLRNAVTGVFVASHSEISFYDAFSFLLYFVKKEAFSLIKKGNFKLISKEKRNRNNIKTTSTCYH